MLYLRCDRPLTNYKFYQTEIVMIFGCELVHIDIRYDEAKI